MSNNYSGPVYYARETNLMYRVYAWMCLGLALTAGTAYYVSITPSFLHYLLTHQGFVLVLFLIQLGLVVTLSMFINRLNLVTAAALFIGYSLLLGITLASIFFVYDLPSIFLTFLVTAGMFAAMALYGYFTRADLSAMGSFLFMALIGLIIGGLVNFFLQSSSFQYVLSAIGVLVFTLLTAYDVQKIKQIMQEQLADRETMGKITIVCALMLYLDFINLFLYLLQFMGRRKE